MTSPSMNRKIVRLLIVPTSNHSFKNQTSDQSDQGNDHWSMVEPMDH